MAEGSNPALLLYKIPVKKSYTISLIIGNWHYSFVRGFHCFNSCVIMWEAFPSTQRIKRPPFGLKVSLNNSLLVPMHLCLPIVNVARIFSSLLFRQARAPFQNVWVQWIPTSLCPRREEKHRERTRIKASPSCQASNHSNQKTHGSLGYWF